MNISHISEETPDEADVSFQDLLESAKRQSLNEVSDAEEQDSSILIKKSVKQMIQNDEVIGSTDFGSGH